MRPLTKERLRRTLILLALLAGLQLGLWAAVGRSNLDDRFHLDEVHTIAVQGRDAGTAPSRYYLCDSRRRDLSGRAAGRTARWLEEAAVEWIAGDDLAPVGPIDPDECDCFSICFTVVINTPAVGVVEATYRPNITYSESGEKWLYLFFLGKWIRVGHYDIWSQW